MGGNFYNPFERGGSVDFFFFFCLDETDYNMDLTNRVNTLLALKEKVWHTRLPFRVLIFQV